MQEPKAEPASRDARDGWEELRITARDGGQIQAFWRAGGKTPFLLAHGRAFDAESFRQFGDLAHEAGHGVLRINFRGYHASTAGSAGPDARDDDVLAAASWLRQHTGHPTIALGASMGGGAVFRAATREPDLFGRLIGWSPVPIPAELVPALTMPKLVVWSADEAMAPALQTYAHELPEPKTLHVFTGNAHAQNLWSGPHQSALTQLVLAFAADDPTGR
ncbi:MAG: alpha/beta fold hydrolase [Thermaerobacter sp.]|nr:alpha/beta fold hydrolase [Thermaerobacter sp.]